MRVVYLHQYFNAPSMSGSTRSYEMGRRLVRRGHEIHLVTADRRRDAPPGWRTSDVEGLTVHWLKVPYSNHLGYPARIRAFLEFAVRTARYSARLQPDLVFASSTPLTVAIPGIYAARRTGTPFVFEVRDVWPEVPIALGAVRNPLLKAACRSLERTAYRQAHAVIALSPGMRDSVVAAGCPTARVTVIPNACDRDLFDVPAALGQRFRSRHRWLGPRPLVVYAGTLGWVNRVDYLVRVAAAARRAEPRIAFLIVGEGAEAESIRLLAAELGVLDVNLFLLPPVAKEQMPEVLSAATLACSLFLPLPAMEANSANKFFDALAAARPVAINYGGWQAEVIRSSGAGLVLDPHDVEAAAHQLVSAVMSGPWLAAAGAAAAGLAQTMFSRDALYQQLQAVLERQVPPVPLSAAPTPSGRRPGEPPR